MGITVDAHSDLLNDILPRRMTGEESVLQNRWLPGMKAGGVDIRVAAIYVSSQFLPESALRRALNLAAALFEELDRTPEAVLCTSGDDIREAKAKGLTGFILGLEGAEPLGSDARLLRVFHALGLRVLGLTHARPTLAAAGAPFFEAPMGQPGGLTEFGVELVRRSEDLGIIVDVSHLNEPGFWDVIRYSRQPVIASHSNSRVLHNHPRNLTDDQIRALADAGGVIGVNACALLVHDNNLDSLLEHIDHLYKVGGREHVGLGPDFCDYLFEYMTVADKAKLPDGGGLPVAGLSGDRDIPRVAEALSRRGYGAGDIDLIMGENFVRVFEAVFKNRPETETLHG